MYGENTKTIAIPIYKVLPYLVMLYRTSSARARSLRREHSAQLRKLHPHPPRPSRVTNRACAQSLCHVCAPDFVSFYLASRHPVQLFVTWTLAQVGKTWKGRRDHAPHLQSQIEGGRRAYAEGESVKDSNEPLKRRKRRRYAVLDADRGIEPGARRSLHRRDRTV